MRRLGLGAGWLIVLGLLAWTMYERQLARSADAERTAAQAAQRQVRNETATLTTRTYQVAAQIAAATRQLAAPPVRRVRVLQHGTTPAEVAAQMAVRRRAWIELDDQVLGRRFRLSAEAMRKLADIQESFSVRVNDVAEAARDNHVNPMAPELKPMYRTEETTLQQRIAQEFGPEVAKALGSTGRRAAEDTVGEVAADLCFSGHPLSLQQADALETALESTASSVMTGLLVTRDARFSPNSPSVIANADDYIAQAQALQQVLTAHLTPDQAALVTNRMKAAELDFAIGATAYATWRAVRKGEPPPAEPLGLPHG